MDSPLSNFLYVLARDHLPVGTVKYLVERAKLPGDPATEMPGLEQIAEDLARQLTGEKVGASTNGSTPVDAEPDPASDSSRSIEAPPIPSDSDGKAEPREGPRRGLAKARALKWINAQGSREIAPAELREALDISRPTQSKVIRELTEEGHVRAIGRNQSKRIFAINPDPDAPPVEPVRDETGKAKVSGATMEKARALLRDKERAKPSELDVLGFSTKTRSRVIAALREEGFITVEYDAHQRMLVVTDEHKTSEPDHDDSGDGDVPVDPEGDAEEKRPAEPGSDEGEGQSGTAPPAAPDPGPRQSRPPRATLPPRRASGSNEDDVTLLAKISDYLNEADEPVWPGEIEDTFSISAERRRKLITMLVERYRVWVVGPTKRPRYVYRGGALDKDKPTIDDGEGLGESEGNFVDRSAERAAEAKAEREVEDQQVADKRKPILEWARGAGTFTTRQVADVFSVSQHVAGRVISKLLADEVLEQLESEKAGGGTTYRVPRPKVRGNNGKRPLDGGGEGATLEGRALAAMEDKPMTVDEMAKRLGVSYEVAVGVVGKLFREGEVRPRKSSKGIHYAVTV